MPCRKSSSYTKHNVSLNGTHNDVRRVTHRLTAIPLTLPFGSVFILGRLSLTGVFHPSGSRPAGNGLPNGYPAVIGSSTGASSESSAKPPAVVCATAPVHVPSARKVEKSKKPDPIIIKLQGKEGLCGEVLTVVLAATVLHILRINPATYSGR